MFKKITIFIFFAPLLLGLCGCVAIVAGAAGGAGTATWLSGKSTQEFNAAYERTINASKAALRSLKLELTKETKDSNIAQLKSKYTDGKEIWIDLRKIDANTTKVEIRVGAVKPDKEAGDKILKKIKWCL